MGYLISLNKVDKLTFRRKVQLVHIMQLDAVPQHFKQKNPT